MKVVKFEADADLKLGTTGGDRAPGLHLSDIIATMKFERDKKFNPENPLDYAILEQGHSWETILANALRERWGEANTDYAGYRPEPLHLDGVHMSPDWFQPAGIHAAAAAPVPVVEEWKATKTSKKKVLEDHQWYWLTQLKAYMWGLSQQHNTLITHGRFRVWYINGDYSWDAKNSDLHLLRDYIRYDVTFTRRELEDNWKQLLQQAKKVGLLATAPVEEGSECPTTRRKTTSPRKRSSLPPENSASSTPEPTSPTSKTSLRRRKE